MHGNHSVPSQFDDAAFGAPSTTPLKKNLMSIKKTIQASLLLVAVLCLLNAQHASALGGKLLDQTGCACCPVCDHVCKLEAEKVEVEKTCYNVEAKVICIPRVVFPWQKARKSACAACDCANRSGRRPRCGARGSACDRALRRTALCCC